MQPIHIGEGFPISANNPMPIPDAAKSDPNSVEMLRVWIAHEGQHVSLRVDVWDDPAYWGVMLADLIRHITNAYHQQYGVDRDQILARIRAHLDAEFESPTDEPRGQILT